MYVSACSHCLEKIMVQRIVGKIEGIFGLCSILVQSQRKMKSAVVPLCRSPFPTAERGTTKVGKADGREPSHVWSCTRSSRPLQQWLVRTTMVFVDYDVCLMCECEQIGRAHV